jgi:hypothetical protein
MNEKGGNLKEKRRKGKEKEIEVKSKINSKRAKKTKVMRDVNIRVWQEDEKKYILRRRCGFWTD